MTSKRGRKKNITNANNKSVISLREMLEKDVIFQLFLYLMILDVYRFYLYIKFIGWIKRKKRKTTFI
jgi:hypothetical protein